MQYRNLLLLLFVAQLLSSCATLVNEPYQSIYVTSNPPDCQVLVEDSIYDLPATINVTRSREDLKLTLMTDSVNKDYYLESRLNSEYIFNNIFFFAGISHLIDLLSDNRFSYDYGSVLLNVEDSVALAMLTIEKPTEKSSLEPRVTRKGQLDLLASIPEVNSYYFKIEGEGDEANTGFLGIALGLEYYLSKDRSLSLSTAATLDFIIPIPAAYDPRCECEFLRAYNTSLTYNIKKQKTTFGIGINYAVNKWTYKDMRDSIEVRKPSVGKYNHAIGLSLNAYRQVGKKFYMGIIYRPSLFTLQPKARFEYQHSISLDFLWKISLN